MIYKMENLLAIFNNEDKKKKKKKKKNNYSNNIQLFERFSEDDGKCLLEYKPNLIQESIILSM